MRNRAILPSATSVQKETVTKIAAATIFRVKIVYTIGATSTILEKLSKFGRVRYLVFPLGESWLPLILAIFLVNAPPTLDLKHTCFSPFRNIKQFTYAKHTAGPVGFEPTTFTSLPSKFSRLFELSIATPNPPFGTIFFCLILRIEPGFVVVKYAGPGGIRTHDIRIKSPPL